MNLLNRISLVINRWLTAVAGICLVGMIALTCGNILLRLVWGPITGAVELTGYLSAVLAAFSLGYTQMRKGHIAVDVLVMAFPRRLQQTSGFLNNLFCFLFFLVVAWQAAERASVLRHTGELSETLQIIYYPFIYCTAFGCLVLSLVLFQDMLQNLHPHPKRGS